MEGPCSPNATKCSEGPTQPLDLHGSNPGPVQPDLSTWTSHLLVTWRARAPPFPHGPTSPPSKLWNSHFAGKTREGESSISHWSRVPLRCLVVGQSGCWTWRRSRRWRRRWPEYCLGTAGSASATGGLDTIASSSSSTRSGRRRATCSSPPSPAT